MHLPVTNGILTATFADHKKRGQKGSFGTDIGFDVNFKGDVPILNCYKCMVLNYGLSATFGYRVWVQVLDEQYKHLYIVYPHLIKINPDITKSKILNEGDWIGFMGNTGLVLNKKTMKIENNNDGHILMPKSRHLHLECRKKIEDSTSSIWLEEIEKAYIK